MSEPTFEEMRPLLQPLAAIVAMHALIGLVHTNGEESAEQRVMTRAIDYADTLMAGLNANALIASDTPAPDTIPLQYEAGIAWQDEAVKELRRAVRYDNLPDNFKRLIGRAVRRIEAHEGQIPF